MTPYVRDPDFTLWQGDVLEVLRQLPDESVDCCVTSPPYWGLRDYQTDGQIGLEPTPAEFVQRMVDVFREVRRVLAPHGTCWVNLGDSYASGEIGRVDAGRTSDPSCGKNEKWLAQAPRSERRIKQDTGLKPKDLCGIPWRVAFALQQPYYAGRIKDERDRIWLAAMVDAEGCIHIHRRKAGASAHSTYERADGTRAEYVRKQDTYGVMVSIDNTSEAVIDRCHAIIGQGSLYTQEAGTGKQQRKQTIHRLTLTGNQSRDLLRELYPHLVAKQREARIAYHCPSSGDDASACHEAIKALHNGTDTVVDRDPPPTLLEPGWYLRSDVIWGKPNPMPESVTDRPTKAHEFVFLLTKQPRYWFDQEAVREPAEYGFSPTTKGRFATSVGGTHGSHTVKPGDGTGGRNIRSVWEIATQPYAEAHFATFPQELPRRCIKAGCPEQVCRTCGKARERIVQATSADGRTAIMRGRNAYDENGQPLAGDNRIDIGTRASFSGRDETLKRDTVGWSDCGHANYRAGVVLDPFLGSGTTALVARELGRHSVGIELNPDYCRLAARRLSQLSLLAEGDAASRSPIGSMSTSPTRSSLSRSATCAAGAAGQPKGW